MRISIHHVLYGALAFLWNSTPRLASAQQITAISECFEADKIEYFFYEDISENFDVASTLCNSAQGRLVTSKTSEQLNFVTNFVNSEQINFRFFIGTLKSLCNTVDDTDSWFYLHRFARQRLI